MDWEEESNNSSISVFFHLSKGFNISRSTIFSAQVTSFALFLFNNIIGIPLTSAGIVANILSTVVFTKQGFTDTINISLVSLSISDLAFLVHTLWQSMSLVPSLQEIKWPFNFAEISMVLGSIPKNFYRRVSGILTVCIAIERCVSLIRPLQVRFIFTRKRLTMTILLIYIVNALPFIRSMLTYRMGWKSDSFPNRTYLGVIVLRGNPLLDSFGMGLGMFISFATFLTVSICTVIMVWSLYKQGQWRRRTSHVLQSYKTKDSKQGNHKTIKEKKAIKNVNLSKTTGDDQNSSAMSERDKRASKTVTFLAAMYVLCYLPGVFYEIAILIVAEFSRRGKFRNAYHVFGVLAVRAETICASANIIVYYRTSTKFRETFMTMFCASRGDNCTSSRSKNPSIK